MNSGWSSELATGSRRPARSLAERDYAVVVTPPARTVEALRSGKIAGLCAGAPWGDIAERAGVGATVATSGDVWRNGPGKALAMRDVVAARDRRTQPIAFP